MNRWYGVQFLAGALLMMGMAGCTRSDTSDEAAAAEQRDAGGAAVEASPIRGPNWPSRSSFATK